MSEKQRMAIDEERDVGPLEDKHYVRSHREGRLEFYDSSYYENYQIDKCDILPVFDIGNCFITERRPIILGVSPGNPYYFDGRNLLKVFKFANTHSDCVKFFIPDAISIHNYRAVGSSKPERKARKIGNYLQRKCTSLLKSNPGLASSEITFVDWVKEVEPSNRYIEQLDYVRTLFSSHEQFKKDALEVTNSVLQNLQNRGKRNAKQNPLDNSPAAVKVTKNVNGEEFGLNKQSSSMIVSNPTLEEEKNGDGEVSCSIPNEDYDISEGMKYLFKELAFFLSLPDIYDGFEKSIFVYHKPWPIFENLLNGVYDGHVRTHLGFVILR